MSDNRSWDSIELPSLDLPYNLTTRELDPTPRIVNGTNSLVTLGGKIMKRPGTVKVLASHSDMGAVRVDRMWVVETLDTPSNIYIVASVYNGSNWNLIYNNVALGTGWTTPTELRQCNHSTQAHEAEVSRGMLYIKGFPSAASGEMLGTVIFDGSQGHPQLKIWGLLGPTTPARITGVVHRIAEPSTNGITASQTTFHLDSVTGLPAAPFNIQIDYELVTVISVTGTDLTVLRGAQGTATAAHADQTLVLYRGWTASTHPIVVNMFWAYTYAYKTVTGHVSNRAPEETNPDNLPSQTGPFLNLLPSITVQGQADTINIPTIVIYRTTDGGGTYQKLGEITNTGTGSITYTDTNLASTSGAVDPTPDANLDPQVVSADLNSNSPPPTVLANPTTWSTLNGSITNSATSLTLNLTYNGTSLHTPTNIPFTITIDSELLSVTAYNAGTGVATVIRGLNNSTPAAHNGAAVVTITPVVGYDTPVPSTPITAYASRLWYAIGNVLFFSAQEELNTGVPEEAWPTGLFGDFFRFNNPIVNVKGSTHCLYVITTKNVYEVTGTTLNTFNPNKILSNVGGAAFNPRGATLYGDALVWITSDYRVGILENNNFRTISEPLGIDYLQLTFAQQPLGIEFGLVYWAEIDKEWIILSSYTANNYQTNQQWVYDIEKSSTDKVDFWNAPWSIPAVAAVSDKIKNSLDMRRKLCFASYDGTSSFLTKLTTYPGEFTGTDVTNTTTINYNFSIRTNLFMVPPGNHVNMLRRPGLVPIIYALVVERTTFTGDVDPIVSYYIDDLWTNQIGADPSENPAHQDPPLGYKTLVFPIQTKGKRFSFEVDYFNNPGLFEIQNFVIIYNSDAGAGV